MPIVLCDTHSIQHYDVIRAFEKLQLMGDEYPRFAAKVLGDTLPVDMSGDARVHRA